MSTTQVQQQLRRFNSMERRPRMLKDFLSENLNSCSSSGFKSLPRKPNNNSMHSLIEMELKSQSSSSSSPFQTLVNTIRSISLFTSMKSKSPSVLSLPRSLSRKLSSSRRTRRRGKVCSDISSITTVKIKDIIRWKSFRDVVDQPPPLDLMVGSSNNTTTTSTTCCSSSSSESSWSESDCFTYSWEEAQNDNVKAGKRFSFSPIVVVGKEPGTQEVLTCQEEQHSPVSVLQVGEDDFSPFDQSLANIQRRKQKFIETAQKLESLAKFDLANLDQCLSLDDNSGYDEEYEEEDEDDYNDNDIEEQDWIEEKAKQLLHCVKARRGSAHGCEDYLDTLLLDFFSEELIGTRNQYKNEEEFELETLRIAEDWIKGSFSFDEGLVDKHAYIKDMDKRDQWSRLEEEQEELAFEIETAILHSLVADLMDLDG